MEPGGDEILEWSIANFLHKYFIPYQALFLNNIDLTCLSEKKDECIITRMTNSFAWTMKS
jgi:hypothetical protein